MSTSKKHKPPLEVTVYLHVVGLGARWHGGRRLKRSGEAAHSSPEAVPTAIEWPHESITIDARVLKDKLWLVSKFKARTGADPEVAAAIKDHRSDFYRSWIRRQLVYLKDCIADWVECFPRHHHWVEQGLSTHEGDPVARRMDLHIAIASQWGRHRGKFVADVIARQLQAVLDEFHINAVVNIVPPLLHFAPARKVRTRAGRQKFVIDDEQLDLFD